jgi:hypothetical protein
MSLGGKIILTVVVCLALFAVGMVGLGAYLWSRHGRELLEAGGRQYDRGVAFGRQTDESGCLDEAVTRYKRNGGVSGSIAAGVFVKACWTTSRPTAGFCDQVPKPLDVFRAARWQTEQSKKAGIDDQFGGQIFAQQRTYCDSRVPPPAVRPR